MNIKSCLAMTVSLFASCALFSALGQVPQWFEQDTGLTGTTRGDDIFFIDQTTGWIARGTNGIYKTIDGGNTWTKVWSSLSPTTGLWAHFRCIGFATPLHGWAGNLGPGSYDAAVTDPTVLYETTDGGTTWNPVQDPAITQSGMKGFCALYIPDSQHVYGAGRVRGPAYFVKSSDQGTTWTVQNLTAAGTMGGIMDVYFKDAMNGFVVGMDNNTFMVNCASVYHGAIARTTDGGNTWSVVATTATAPTPMSCCYFWKMAWPSANVGYVSLQQNSGMIGHVFFKTVDGGATWTQYIIPFSSIDPAMTSFYWQGIGFVSETEGWAGGSNTQLGSLPDTFLHTSDGGLSWTPVGFNNSQYINRIRVTDPTLAHASGAKAYIYRIPVGISQPPQSQVACIGGSVSFNVTPVGNPPFTYQWYKDGTAMPGKTDMILTLNNLTAADAGTYSVTAANTWDSATSSGAVLTLLNPVTITAQPMDQTVAVNGTASFSVTTSAGPPTTYQWYKNGQAMPGQTAPTLTLHNVSAADSGTYYTVVVQDGCGPVTSSAATLTVVSPPYQIGIGLCSPVVGEWSFGPNGLVHYYITILDFEDCIRFVPQPIQIGDPFEFQISALQVPLGWTDLPEVKRVQSLLKEAEVDQPLQLYLLPEFQRKLKPVDLGIQFQAEGTNAVVKQTRRIKGGAEFLVRGFTAKEMTFDLSGKLPKGTKPGEIFLVLITVHDEKAANSHTTDFHFTEILDVQSLSGRPSDKK